MKTKIINVDGKTGKEIVLPELFSSAIREDIIIKAIEAFKKWQPYGPNVLSGMKYSASGKIRHGRRLWKTSYGRGISRVPKKILWRRGTQFYWIGATVSGTVGGRRAHPPKPESMISGKRINKKELKIALSSAVSSTVNEKMIKSRYKTLKDKEIKIELPVVVSSDIAKLKTKELKKLFKEILKDAYLIAERKKSIRAGKGTMRNRRYKKSAGLLLVISNEEKIKASGFDVKKVNELSLLDFYPLGRLAIYTEKAVADLEKLTGSKKNG